MLPPASALREIQERVRERSAAGGRVAAAVSISFARTSESTCGRIDVGDRTVRAAGRTDGRTGGRANGRTGGLAAGRTGGRADGRTGGRADGRTGGRADGRTGVDGHRSNEQVLHFITKYRLPSIGSRGDPRRRRRHHQLTASQPAHNRLSIRVGDCCCCCCHRHHLRCGGRQNEL